MLINAPLLKTGLLIAGGLFLTAVFIGPRLADRAKFSADQESTIQWSDGGVVEEQRDLPAFDAIKVTDGIDLYLSQGDREAVTVRTDERYLDQVRTTVENNVLYVEVEGNIHNPEALDVLVTVRDLRELHAQGGSDVFAEEGLDLESLRLFCSGGSDTRLNLRANSLQSETSGGSDVILSGEVENLEVHSSGGSDFNGKNLRVVNARVHSSGASDAWIYATGEVDLEASGASDIHLQGEAKVVRSHASGGADIHY